MKFLKLYVFGCLGVGLLAGFGVGFLVFSPREEVAVEVEKPSSDEMEAGDYFSVPYLIANIEKRLSPKSKGGIERRIRAIEEFGRKGAHNLDEEEVFAEAVRATIVDDQ